VSGVCAYIGLGSNLDTPIAQVERALAALAMLPESRLVVASSLYRSDPLGPAGQPDYINAVAELHTRLAPLDLLDALQAQELAQRRVRLEHWGPRTLDLDLLLYGAMRIDLPRLQVPHPQMLRRNFVLLPLVEIAPGLQLPDGSPIHRHLAVLGEGGIQRL